MAYSKFAGMPKDAAEAAAADDAETRAVPAASSLATEAASSCALCTAYMTASTFEPLVAGKVALARETTALPGTADAVAPPSDTEDGTGE